jgi:hypothetical protein
MSGDFLEATYDKFIFRVKKDYLYHPEECWAKEAWSPSASPTSCKKARVMWPSWSFQKQEQR